jgi:hypothetical protein
MRRIAVGVTLAAAALLAPVAGAAATAAPRDLPSSASPAAVSVEIRPTRISTTIGTDLRFVSVLRNDGDQPVPGLVAHLNVFSLDPDTYVDPEDWSASRTRYLPALPAGGSNQIDWTIQAVNSGRFVIYVAVSAEQGSDLVTASNVLRMSAAARRTIDAGGVVPIAVAVPGGVLVLMAVAAGRRRRLRPGRHSAGS